MSFRASDLGLRLMDYNGSNQRQLTTSCGANTTRDLQPNSQPAR